MGSIVNSSSPVSSQANAAGTVSKNPMKMSSAQRDALVLKVIKVAVPIIITLGILAACGAAGPGGWVVGGLVLTTIAFTAVAYMVEHNTFGIRSLPKKVTKACSNVFTSSKPVDVNPDKTTSPIYKKTESRVKPVIFELNPKVNVLDRPERTQAQLIDTKPIHSNEFSEILKQHYLGDGIVGCDVPTTVERHGIKTTRYSDAQGNVQYEFNEFKKGFYNDVKAEHFIKRLDLIFDTAKAVHGLEADTRTNLSKMQAFYAGKIDEAVSGIEIKVGTPLTSESKTEFDTKYNAAKELLQDAFEDVKKLVQQEKPETVDLAQLEKEFIHGRGRPTIINIFQISGQERSFVSIQKPLFEITQPSTIRNQEGLSNASMTFTGYVNESGAVTITHEAARHTSTPPIAIDSAYERQKIAAGNVMQELEKLVELKIGASAPSGNSEEHPVGLTFNAMILLTPKPVDAARNRKKIVAGEWTGVGETLMLKESLQSLYFYNTRTIQINGIWVKIDVSAMNLGVNTAVLPNSKLGKLPNAQILKGLNAQGFMEFEIQTDDFIYRNIASDPTLKILFEEYCQLKNHKTNHEFFNLKRGFEGKLLGLHKRLETLFKTDPLDKKAIDETNKEINKIEKMIRRGSLNLFKEKCASYEDQKDALIAKREEILDHLTEIISASGDDEINNQQLETLKNVFLNQAEFARSIIEKDNLKAESIMNSQAIYIDTMSLMNSWVAFFCKSGEDRTGAVDVEVASRIIQRTLGQRVDIDKIREVAYRTHISRQVTRENSDAEGLQFSYPFVPERIQLPIWAQNKVSKLAKGVVKKDQSFIEMIGGIFGWRKLTAWEEHLKNL